MFQGGREVVDNAVGKEARGGFDARGARGGDGGGQSAIEEVVQVAKVEIGRDGEVWGVGGGSKTITSQTKVGRHADPGGGGGGGVQVVVDGSEVQVVVDGRSEVQGQVVVHGRSEVQGIVDGSRAVLAVVDGRSEVHGAVDGSREVLGVVHGRSEAQGAVQVEIFKKVTSIFTM